MRVNRRFLYWGVFLVALGAMLVAADLRAIDTATLTDAVRLWPLAVVAFGLTIVVRRTRLSLPGTFVAAALPGLVLGAAFAVAPRFAGDCGARGELANDTTAEGSFDGPAEVSIRTGCGELNVSTAAGNDWRLETQSTIPRAPRVDHDGHSLSVAVLTDDGRTILDAGRDAWDLTIPTSPIERLSVVATTADARLDLTGADIAELAVTANAADVIIDASSASLADLSAVINVGALAVDLPADSNLTGSLRVGAGELLICAPPGLGLRVTTRGLGDGVVESGLRQRDSVYQSPHWQTAEHRADLTVRVNFGSVEIDPIGGCE
jgi:hypothetical protein